MSNPFGSLTNAEIRVRKPGGAESAPHKCTLTNDKAVVFDPALDATEGDRLLRRLPNGKDEVFTILEVQFQPKFSSIPAHYTLTLRKDGSLVERRAPHSITVTNSQGVLIGDHSVQNIVGSLELFIGAIEASNAPHEQKAEARQQLKAFLAHPLVSALLGAAAGGLAAKL